jgi:DNA-binding transcriptional LysR family regulator
MTDFIIGDALVFISVAEEGSFAAAAKKLFISPSVISKRISRLENQLRVQLIQRTTRTMSLTESGDLFYEHCKRIKAEINDAADKVLQQHQIPSGLLRINVPRSFGQVHLIPAINEFLFLYPEMKIELIFGSQYANFIYKGLDLAIFINDLPNTSLLKSRKIAVRNNGVYGSPQYFERFGMPEIPDDLRKHNCLIYQSEPGNSLGIGQKHEWRFYKNKEKLIIPVSGNLRINSNQGLVKAAIAGVGLVKLSSFMVTEEIKTGKLLSILNNYCEHNINIHAAYPSQRYLPYKVRIFIDFLLERFNSENYWKSD